MAYLSLSPFVIAHELVIVTEIRATAAEVNVEPIFMLLGKNITSLLQIYVFSPWSVMPCPWREMGEIDNVNGLEIV